MAEYIKLSEFEKAVFVKQEEEKKYWFDWLKQFRATKEYPIKETAVDNFLRGYGEAVQYMLSVNEQLLFKSADAVEVVRCKNCKYFDIEEDDALGTCMGKFICVSSGGEIYPEPNHYCSYGERRSDNG